MWAKRPPLPPREDGYSHYAPSWHFHVQHVARPSHWPTMHKGRGKWVDNPHVCLTSNYYYCALNHMHPPSQIASFAIDLLYSSPLLVSSQHISSPQIALASMFSLHHRAISQASLTLMKHILVQSEASIPRVAWVNMQFLLLCHGSRFSVLWKGFEIWVQGVGRNCEAISRNSLIFVSQF